jgi:hypothetical protein
VGAPTGFNIAALQQQMRALPRKIETFQQRHGDISRVKARVESIQRHFRAGELEKAFEEHSALNPMLESP